MSLYVARSSAIAARVLDGEMIVMSARDSSLFTLNEIGTEIWNAADGHTPLDEIVRTRVCAAFEVEPEEACADAEAFCRELAGHGILLLSEQPIEPAQIPTI
jgi:Coenzyme PQQ synthesis protein D (PqqD)